MGKIDLLKTVLDKKEEYFIVEKVDYYSTFGSHREANLSIWLIALPEEIQRQFKYDVNGLTVQQVDKILNTYIGCNIPLSDSHAPFQRFISLNSFSRAYPVTASREFIRKAWALKSTDIWDYVKLDKKLKDQRQKNG